MGSQARTGDIEGARKIAETIESVGARDYAVYGIALVQAKAGDLEEALKIAETIGEDSYKGHILSRLVGIHAKAGRFKKAVDLTETIADDASQAGAWIAIAEAQIKAKEHAAARENLKKALDIAHEIEKGDGQAVVTGEVAKVQMQMGEVEKALKTADTIKSAMWKSSALRDLVALRAKAGDWKEARKIADTIPQEYRKGDALKEIVTAYLDAGEDKAAMELAETIDSVAQRIESLLEIAKFRARKDGRAAADKIFQKAFREAENVRDEEPQIGNIRNAVLAHIIQAQAEAGAAKDALAWAAKQDAGLLKTQTLFGIAKGLRLRQQARKRPRE